MHSFSVQELWPTLALVSQLTRYWPGNGHDHSASCVRHASYCTGQLPAKLGLTALCSKLIIVLLFLKVRRNHFKETAWQASAGGHSRRRGQRTQTSAAQGQRWLHETRVTEHSGQRSGLQFKDFCFQMFSKSHHCVSNSKSFNIYTPIPTK